MALRQYDIARLVHHYLAKEGYDSVAELFVSTCPHLSGLKGLSNSQQGAKKLPRLLGPSLSDLFEEYLDGKDHLIEELEQLECVDFRPQDSLPTLLKTLVRELKKNSQNAPRDVPSRTNNVFANTEAVSEPKTKQSSDPETLQGDQDILETVDFAAMYDRMLEDTELHEKLAESINKNILNHMNQSKSSSDPLLSSTSNLEVGPMQDLVEAVVEETESDPLFINILKEFIGDDELVYPCNNVLPLNESENDLSDAAPISNCPSALVSETNHQPNCSPTKSVSQVSNLSETQVISPSKAAITLNSYALVTSANGQVTLIPSLLSTIPTIKITPEVAQEKASKPRKRPVAIAPKPPTPIKPQTLQVEESAPQSKVPANDVSDLSAQVDSAVKEAISDFDQELTLIPCDPKQPPIKVRISGGRQMEIDSSPSSADPSKSSASPLVKEKSQSPLTQPAQEEPVETIKSVEQGKLRRKKSDAVPERRHSTANARPHLPLLSHLVKLASEAAEKSADRSAVEETPVPSTSQASVKEVPKSTPALQSVPQPVLSTPASAGRRRSHVRVLDFGVSPDPDDDSHIGTVPASTSTPWDSRLRQLASSSSGPSDSQIFSTPKGKAKRARKSSPKNAAQSKPAADSAPELPLSSVEPATEPPAVNTSPHEASMETDSSGNVTAVDTTVVDKQNKAETSLTTVTVTVDTESVTAQLLSEIVSSPTKEPNGSQPTGNAVGSTVDQLAQPDVASAGTSIDQPFMSSLFTPQKPFCRLTYEGTMSSAFGWDGEVPRTPQIKMEATSSSSPFLVSLTKGFQFLPAADSPSLAATPLTPSILNYGQSSSVETPFANLSRMLGILSTPRLEALRNEVMESPGKDASNTMISPTQFVLGRSTPYFVPSGERARGPFQQIATPEHQSEERVRRVPSELVGPLRLEDADDISTIADSSSKTITEQPGPSSASAGSKEMDNTKAPLEAAMQNDANLENILISECERLDHSQTNDASSAVVTNSAPVLFNGEKPKLRDKYIELFGEDSTMSVVNGPSPMKVLPASSVVSSAAETCPETAPEEPERQPPRNATRMTQEPSREAISAWWKNGKNAATEATNAEKPEETSSATAQLVPDSPLILSKSQRRAKPLLDEEDSTASDRGDNEEVIQELLMMASKAAKIDTSALTCSKTPKLSEPSSSKRKSRTRDCKPQVSTDGLLPPQRRVSLPNPPMEDVNALAAEDGSQDKPRSRSSSKSRRCSVSAETQPEPFKLEPMEASQKRKSRSTSRKSALPSEPESSAAEVEPKKNRRSRRSSVIEDRPGNQPETKSDESRAPESAASESNEKPEKARSRRKSVTKIECPPVVLEPVETDLPLTESEAKSTKSKRKARSSLPASSSKAASEEVTAKASRRSASPKIGKRSPSKSKVSNSKKEKVPLKKTDKGRAFRSPPKLFKSILPPYGRKAVSFRQSVGASISTPKSDSESSLFESNNNKPDSSVIDLKQKAQTQSDQVLSTETKVGDDVEDLLAELHGEPNPQNNPNSSDPPDANSDVLNGHETTPGVESSLAGADDENLNFDAILSDIAANGDADSDDSSLTGKPGAKSSAANVSMVRPAECSPPYPHFADDAGRSAPAEEDLSVKHPEPAESLAAPKKSSKGARAKSSGEVVVATRKSPRKRAIAEVCPDLGDLEDGKKKSTSQIGQKKSNGPSGKLGNYLELMKFANSHNQPLPPSAAVDVPAEAATPEATQADPSPNNCQAKIVMTSLVRRLQKRLVVTSSDLYSQ